MENIQKNDGSRTDSPDKWELKDDIGPDQVKVILRKWLIALEENRDLTVTINGQTCHVPKEAFSSGKTKAEFEFKKGQYEFELELKWRDTDLKQNQLN